MDKKQRCKFCKSRQVIKRGIDRLGKEDKQRWTCKVCRKTFAVVIEVKDSDK